MLCLLQRFYYLIWPEKVQIVALLALLLPKSGSHCMGGVSEDSVLMFFQELLICN